MEILQFITDRAPVDLSSNLTALRQVSLLAHQGGWDEILLVAGPIAVIVVLLAIVKRRIDAHHTPTDGEVEIPDTSTDFERNSVDGSSDSA